MLTFISVIRIFIIDICPWMTALSPFISVDSVTGLDDDLTIWHCYQPVTKVPDLFTRGISSLRIGTMSYSNCYLQCLITQYLVGSGTNWTQLYWKEFFFFFKFVFSFLHIGCNKLSSYLVWHHSQSEKSTFPGIIDFFITKYLLWKFWSHVLPGSKTK